MKITDEQFAQLQNEHLTIDFWYLELGIKYVYHNVPEGIQFIKPYPEIGKAFWNKIEGNLHQLFCANGKPKEFLNELIDGEYRNLIQALIPVAVATLSIPIAIAIPIVALVTKKGLHKFCRKKVKVLIDSEEIKKIIEDKIIESELSKKKK